jgi:hypothetical protein
MLWDDQCYKEEKEAQVQYEALHEPILVQKNHQVIQNKKSLPALFIFI